MTPIVHTRRSAYLTPSPPASLRFAVLTPGLDTPDIREESLPYDKLVQIVGYPVEVLTIAGGKASMYICEDGKRLGMPENRLATRIAQGALRNGDWVAGVALLVGPTDAVGNDTSLPKSVLA